MSYIEFNNQKSSDFGLILSNEITLKSPSVNRSFQKIDGVDGEIAIGDGMLKNTSREFPFTVKSGQGVNVESVATAISNWLKKDSEWHDLYFAGEPDYVYRGLYYEEYDVSRVVSWYGKCLLKFTVKPYKFLKSGLTETTLANTITNPTERNARPKLTIRGSGNITITIGNQTCALKNVSQGIIIDTLYQTVTSLNNTPAWTKITSYPLPVIEPGTQSITVSGTVTDIKVIPRWEVIV